MKFTESHEWAEEKKGEVRVGITDFAQKELGEVVYVELPKVGARVKKGEEVCVLESTKSATDIYSPITGTISSVNQALVDNPSLINSSAQDKGWLFTIKAAYPQEFDDLLDLLEYESMVYQ